MATATEQLVLQMSADMTRLNRNVVAGQRAFDRQLLAMERRAQAADRNLSRAMGQAGQNMTNSLKSGLAGIAPTLAAAFSAQQVIAYADAYTNLQNRLKATGLEGDRLAATENKLYDTANKNGVAIEAVTQLYQRATMARQNLGASEAELQAFVSGTAGSLKLQGTSATEASGALLQLGQVLGGNMVQAQEYNSLIDGAPVILEAVAKGSERWGGSINKLTLDVKAGKVSAQEFFQAALKGFADIEARAAASTVTVGSALQTLNNELGRFVGQTDTSMSATARMAQAILWLSENLDTVTQIVGVLGVVMGTRLVLALTASTTAMAAQGVAAVRLALFQAAMTASMTGTGTATVLATNAMRAFTVAIMANPLGAAIIAVAALATGLYLLNNRYGDAAVAARELDAATTASNTALSEYEKAAMAAEQASGKGATAAREHAAAMREEANAAIVAARALAQKRIAAAEADRSMAQAAYQEAIRPGFREPGSELGAVAFAAGAQARYRRSQEAAGAAIREQIRQEQEFQRIAAGGLVSAPRSAVTPTRTGGGGGGGRTGPDPKDLEAMRLMLRLQAELEVHRAAGRTAEADMIQRQIDVINLTKQYKEAELPDAEAAAQAQVDRVYAAERFHKLQEEAREGAKAFEEEQAAADQRRNDLLMDRLGYEAELARLSGDPARIEAAERELFIAERVNELLRLRPELTQAAATAQAGREYGELDDSEREGKMRDEFRNSFKEGIKTAIEGDLGGFFESMADRFTDRMLDNLADNLFDLISQAAKGMSAGGGGGGWMSTIASLFGKRATGGPVTAGSPYIVGERRPEVFVPNVNGTVIPSMNAAMGRMDQAQGRLQQAVNVTVGVNDDRFNAYVDGRATPVAVQTAGTAVAYQQDQSRTASRRRRQSLI